MPAKETHLMNVTHSAYEGRSSFAAPLGNVTTGRLELVRGASNMNLRALARSGESPADTESLIEASFEGTPPEVQIAEGDVRIVYQHRFWFFDCLRVGADIALHPAVTWSVAFRGGASRVNADLSGLAIGNVEIRGGVSDLRLVLPRPIGTLNVRVAGGVSDAVLLRPSGVPIRVSVRDGAAHLHIDRLVLGAVGSPIEWESPDYATSADRVDIEIAGGASDLTVRANDHAPSRRERASAIAL
jgi:hypothetical protein